MLRPTLARWLGWRRRELRRAALARLTPTAPHGREPMLVLRVVGHITRSEYRLTVIARGQA